MFVRVVKGSSKQYVLIVRSFRDKEGKSRQETVFNLGPVTESTREATVNLAKRMIANLDGGQIITDGREIQEIIRRNWGAPAIIENLWQRFAMNKAIKSTKSQAIKLMLIGRLLSPGSKLDIYNNRKRYEGFEDIDLNHLYRAVDYLAENAENIKKHIFEKQRLQMTSEIVFFDVTTLYFESQKADLIRDFGYSKDCKFNEVQIVLCLVIDEDGRPLSYEIFAGNTFEGTTLLPMLERFKEQFHIKKLIIVADRGIGSKTNLNAIKQAGYDYIIGAKLRAASKVIQEEAICENGFRLLYLNEDEGESIKYKIINNGEQKWVILHSNKRARKDELDRQRLIQKAQEMISNGQLDDKRGAKKFISIEKSSAQSASLDLEKIAKEAKFDGYYAISFSDNNLSASTISKAYHGLWRVEESFRTLKSFFEIRPIFHWTKKRIEGHILMNFIALIIENHLISAIKNTYTMSHNKLRYAISTMEMSILSIEGSNFSSYAPMSEEQLNILQALNIDIPKNQKL